MTSKEREEFKKKLEARKKQRELDTNNKENDNKKPNNITKDSDESKFKFNLIDLFKKAEELEPLNLESLTPYEREEVKNKYKLMAVIFGIISFILILWVLSWVV